MKYAIKALVCLIGGAISITGASLPARATVADAPYKVIPVRNVFDLKDPVVTNTWVPPSPPPPNIKLTGISTMLGTKRAFFMIAPPAQPGKPPGKEESYILEEGQQQGGIEVLEINQKAANVRIKIEGSEMLVALDETSRLPSVPGGALPDRRGGPAGPNSAAMPARAKNGLPFGQRQFANGNAAGQLPLPQRQAEPVQPTPQQPEMSLEQTAILTEIERQRTQPLVDQGMLPPIPDVLGLQNSQQNQNGGGGNRGVAGFPTFPTASH